MPGRNALLACQLAALGLDAAVPPSAADWDALLKCIGRSYAQADRNRELVERSMALSSAEMRVLQQELRVINAGLESRVDERTAELLNERARTTKALYFSQVLHAVRDLDNGNLGAFLHATMEAAARALNVTRASVWFYDPSRSAIVCRDLYDGVGATHQQGLRLAAVDYPGYFAALGSGAVLDAHDALTDSRTREFADGYLRPLGIVSMLGAPLRLGTRLEGVLCLEHTGSPRHWSHEEMEFAQGLAGILMYVDSRERSAEQLRRSEARFRMLFALSSDWVWEQDVQHRFVLTEGGSHERGGITAAVHVGKCRWELPGTDIVGQSWSEHQAVLDARLPFTDLLLRRTAADGSLHFVRVAGEPSFDGAGTFTGYIGVAKDETERMRSQMALAEARDAAQAANIAKSQFLANMSHEIRTPMNGVLGMADLLLDEPLAAAQRGRVEAIRSSGEALLRIIDDILDLSKIEAGKLALEIVPTDLRALVEKVRQLLEPACTAKGVAFVCEVAPGVAPFVQADSLRVRQILINLVGNAVKFTADGMVLVRIGFAHPQDAQGTVRFAITDTGTGIDPRAQAELFTPFTQADASISRTFGGSGLGLAISRQLAEAMGGQIGVESGPGGGSLFWFVLPMSAATGTTPAQLAGPALLDETAITSLRFDANVLLAEDNFINQQVARGALQKLGCHVTTVNNGREALAAIARERFDLVLMDCQMPELDGLAATRLLREQEAGSGTHLPVVALTANAFAADRAACDAAGMDDYISKPFRPEELARALARWLKPAVTAPVRMMAAASIGNVALARTPGGTTRSQPTVAPAIFDAATLARLNEYQVPGEEDMVTGLLEHFLASAAIHISAMERAVQEADWRAAGAVAHTFKTSAGYVGALQLSAACTRLEDAVQAGHVDPVVAICGEVQRAYAGVLPFLRAALDATRAKRDVAISH